MLTEDCRNQIKAIWKIFGGKSVNTFSPSLCLCFICFSVQAESLAKYLEYLSWVGYLFCLPWGNDYHSNCMQKPAFILNYGKTMYSRTHCKWRMIHGKRNCASGYTKMFSGDIPRGENAVIGTKFPSSVLDFSFFAIDILEYKTILICRPSLKKSYFYFNFPNQCKYFANLSILI